MPIHMCKIHIQWRGHEDYKWHHDGVGFCRNPSLGLATKARGYKVAGQEGDPEVTSHAPRSAKSVREWTLTLPSVLPVVGAPESLERNYRGQNPLIGRIFNIIEKLLKRRCLKWVFIAHLNIWNTSYYQKKGRESNWQFDPRPLKVGNWPDSLTCRWCATYTWKALDESYNFVLDLIVIRSMHAKLWAPKLRESQLWEFRDAHLGVLGQKAIWMWPPWRGAKYTIRGKVVASPKFGLWWVLWIRVARGSS
jgi:hypothetical protein